MPADRWRSMSVYERLSISIDPTLPCHAADELAQALETDGRHGPGKPRAASSSRAAWQPRLIRSLALRRERKQDAVDDVDDPVRGLGGVRRDDRDAATGRVGQLG